MKIKKKNTTIPINGKIVDTENVEDKTSNAPSMRLVEEMVKDIYSTEEVRIGTWLGKPLYRKVINLTAPICEKDGTYVSKMYNISNNVDFAVIELGFIKDEYNQIQTFPYINNSGNCIKAFVDLNKKINLVHNINSYSSKEVTVSVKYTKTTD